MRILYDISDMKPGIFYIYKACPRDKIYYLNTDGTYTRYIFTSNHTLNPYYYKTWKGEMLIELKEAPDTVHSIFDLKDMPEVNEHLLYFLDHEGRYPYDWYQGPLFFLRGIYTPERFRKDIERTYKAKFRKARLLLDGEHKDLPTGYHFVLMDADFFDIYTRLEKDLYECIRYLPSMMRKKTIYRDHIEPNETLMPAERYRKYRKMPSNLEAFKSFREDIYNRLISHLTHEQYIEKVSFRVKDNFYNASWPWFMYAKLYIFW